MKKIFFFLLVLPFAGLFLAGCTGQTTEKKGTAVPGTTAPAKATGQEEDSVSVQANLEKLSPLDRKLAEEQEFCGVESKNLLGSMGVPVKVMIQDQPVFLCCNACRSKALAHVDRTLAKVKELKERKAGTPKN